MVEIEDSEQASRKADFLKIKSGRSTTEGLQGKLLDSLGRERQLFIEDAGVEIKPSASCPGDPAPIPSARTTTLPCRRSLPAGDKNPPENSSKATATTIMYKKMKVAGLASPPLPLRGAKPLESSGRGRRREGLEL